MLLSRMIYLSFFIISVPLFATHSCDWLTHYVQAEKAYNQKNGPVAIEEYSKGIELAPEQLCLYMGRGKTYEKMKKYEESLQDFSFIINYPNVHNKHLVPALWARARIHLMLHDYENMHQDYEAVTAIDQNILETSQNENYLVLKNINSNKVSDPNFQQQYAAEMIHRGYCKSIKDITFTNNGNAIIKLKKNCGCQNCQDVENNLEKKAF